MIWYAVDYTNNFGLFWYNIGYNSVILLKTRLIAQLEYLSNASLYY